MRYLKAATHTTQVVHPTFLPLVITVPALGHILINERPIYHYS
jgi:hypothetical protein